MALLVHRSLTRFSRASAVLPCSRLSQSTPNSRGWSRVPVKRGLKTSAVPEVLGQFTPAFVRENTWEAWDESSRQRLDFNLLAEPRIVQAEPLPSSDRKDSTFRVQFSDGHVGRFDALGEAADVWMRDLPHQPRQLWGTVGQKSVVEVNQELQEEGALRFDFSSLSDRSMQLRWVEAMHVYGVTVISGLPTKEDTVIDFANMMAGYVHPTVYGQKFSVKAVDNPNNLAFSSDGLQMHTDLPFYGVPPSIQLFHCLTQAKEGGESLFLDGFDVATALLEDDPDAFRTLTQVPVRFQDLTDDWHLSARHPTIEVESNEDHTDSASRLSLRRVCFNERARDSWRDWSPSNSSPSTSLDFYRALRAFEALVEQRSRYVRLVLQPGEMACTDNWRVMHSRGGFTGARHLEGAYIDWDALYGRWRAGSPAGGLSKPTFPMPCQ